MTVDFKLVLARTFSQFKYRFLKKINYMCILFVRFLCTGILYYIVVVTCNKYQLSQMDPRDALPQVHRAVQRGGRSV